MIPRKLICNVVGGLQMKSFINASEYIELAISECGKEECVKNKATCLGDREYHLFHYVLLGKGTLVINKKEYRLSKGHIFFIPKNAEAIYYPDKDDPWVYEWVGFTGTRVDSYLEALNLSIDHPVIIDRNKTYKQYFNSIVKRYVNNGYNDIASLGALYELFGEMIFDKEGTQTMSRSSVTVQLAKDFIRNNYRIDITIEDIAKNSNVTPNYLSAIFQKEEGMTTKRYLTKTRMTQAMALLQSGKMKVKDVSEAVGYPNQLHFSNEFKKYFGKSPISYLGENKQ